MERYLVGGYVRDRLQSRPARDRDWVVVGATPAEMEALGFRRVGKDFPVFLHPETGEEHALARVAWKEGDPFRPAATLVDDLAHRDLTINAMAMTAEGRLIDPFGGAGDLAKRMIRHVGPPFADDPIRILRAARFAAQLDGFAIAPPTMALMAELVSAGALDGATPERVWMEIDKALGAARPSVFFMAARACGALARVLPEIDALFGVPQPEKDHPEIDTGLHTMKVVDTAARLTTDRAERFAALVHDLGKAATPPDQWPRHRGHERRGARMVPALVRRLAGPNAYAELGALVAEWHGHVHKAGELRPGTLLELLDAADAFHRPRRLTALLLAAEADARAAARGDFMYPQARVVRRARKAAALVTAGQLIAEGFAPGPRLGEVLVQRRVEAIRAQMTTPPGVSNALRAANNLDAGRPAQVTCLLAMGRLFRANPELHPAFAIHLLERALAEITPGDGHPEAPDMIRQTMALIRDGASRPDRSDLAGRINALQPGWKRVWVHASHRRGADRRLLMCEEALSFRMYGLCAYYVANWTRSRFLLDGRSADRIRAIVAWWTRAMAERRQ
ncbi:MAG: multifunctional CCA addition/repair protein [Alphaproteobacteria bacterium]|nr:multifunctional CCA addition/repair protein [Alphaproteobacteria bacterium]